jgi:hypothetical protein
LEEASDRYVLGALERQIEAYEKEKKGYEKEFEQLRKRHLEIRHQESLPGIGTIHAVKIVSRVVSPYRFPDKGNYLSYCGLVKLDKVSGGRSYGQKNSRYCHQLKSVYKTGAFAAVGEGKNNPIHNYYEFLIREKGYPEYQARHAASRRLAILSWGVFKSKKEYQPFSGRNDEVNQQEVVSDL